MDFINKQVTHCVFGGGRIVALENGYLTVLFSGEKEQKKFRYPEVFERFLQMADKEAADCVECDLQDYKKKIQAQRTAAIEMARKKEERRMAQQILSVKSKRTRNSKGAVSKRS